MVGMLHMAMTLSIILLACALIYINNKMNKLRRNLRSAEINIIDHFERILPNDKIDDAVDVVTHEIEIAMKG